MSFPPSTSVVESPTLFNETREMYIVSTGDTSRGAPDKREMKLKITKRTLDNNEKEIRFELSCPSDDDFVYAGGITENSYPRIVEKFNVKVKFDKFAQALISQLTPSGTDKHIDIYCSLSDNRSKCTLQIWRSSDINLRTLPFEMRAVQGEELMSYLKGALRVQTRTSKANAENLKKARVRLEELETEVERTRKVYEENVELREELQKAQNEAQDSRVDMSEHKLKWEVAEKELEEIRYEMEEMEEMEDKKNEEIELLKDDLDEALRIEEEARRKNTGLGEEVDELTAKVHRLERELDNANRRLREADNKIASLQRNLKKEKDSNAGDLMLKFVKNTDELPVQSCDERKLKELEADLTEKNELIDRLSVNVNEMTRRLDESEQSRVQLEQANLQLQLEVEKANKLVDVYRRSSPSTHTTPHHVLMPSYSSPHYSSSPLSAYSTPPTVPTMATPFLARQPPLGRLDLQQRLPLAPLNRQLDPVGARPHTPNGRPLGGPIGMAAVPPSPQVISYLGPTKANPLTQKK